MAGAPAFVDGIGVLLKIVRDGLSGINVYEEIPDHLFDHLPALVINRTGGASNTPTWTSGFFCHFQVWSRATDEYPNDPYQATYELSQKVARLLYQAWRDQTVARDGDGKALGWIASWRESSGFQRLTDADLPNDVGRYVAVYDLLIRNPRSA